MRFPGILESKLRFGIFALPPAIASAAVTAVALPMTYLVFVFAAGALTAAAAVVGAGPL